MKTASALSDLAVRYQPINCLVPHPRNSRVHSKHQVRRIAESIREFGFTNPVLIAPITPSLQATAGLLRQRYLAWIECQRLNYSN
jgi:hypothetical protein